MLLDIVSRILLHIRSHDCCKSYFPHWHSPLSSVLEHATAGKIIYEIIAHCYKTRTGKSIERLCDLIRQYKSSFEDVLGESGRL